MSHRFFVILAVGALLSGCASGVDDGGEHDSDANIGQSTEALEVAAPAAAAGPDTTVPTKPQPDPWNVVGPRQKTSEGVEGVDPGKPQPDPWRHSTTSTANTTSSK